MSTPLLKIRKSGFNVALSDTGNLRIEPASGLTEQQRQFLKTNKADIVRELKLERMKHTGDEQRVLNWLASIGETDQEIIEDTLNRCRADRESMEYFIGRANERGQSK